MKIYCFGDSWTAEYFEDAELQLFAEQNEVCKSWPTMLSEILQIEIVNKAVPSSSQLSMIHYLTQCKLEPKSHVIFALSAPSRRMSLTSAGEVGHLYHDKNKFAVNDYEDSWQSALACFLSIKLCEQQDCTPWFLCLFDKSYDAMYAHHLWKMIDQNYWILPPDTTIVREVFDPKWFKQWQEQKNSDFLDWLKTNNQFVKTYIRPCVDHPNQTGRQKIAEYIAKKIKEKVQI